MAGAVASLVTAPLGAATTNWLGTTSDWFTPTNWSGGAVPTGGDVAVFPVASVSSPDVGGGAARVLGLTFDNSATSYSLAGTGTLSIGTNGLTSGGGGTNQFTPFVALASPQTWDIGANTTVSLGNALVGVNTLTKTGDGTLELAYIANSYVGGFVINGGVLQPNGAGVSAQAIRSNRLTIGVGGAFNASSAAGTPDTGEIAGAGTVNVGTKGLFITTLADATFSGTMTLGSGSAGLTVRGIGTQTLTGNTSAAAGSPSVGTSSGLTLAGAATLTNTTTASAFFRGGTLTLDNTTSAVADRINDAANLDFRGGGTFVLRGGSETLNVLTINAGRSRVVVQNGGNLTFSNINRAASTGAVDFAISPGSKVTMTGSVFLKNGIIGSAGNGGFSDTLGFATVNGADWATYDTTAGTVRALGAFNAATEPNGYQPFPTTPQAGDPLQGGTLNALLSGNANTAGLNSGDPIAKFELSTLKIAPTAANQSLDINGTADLDVAAVMLVGGTDYKITSSGGGKIAGVHTRYFQVNDPAATLTVDADVSGLGPAGPAGSGNLQYNPITKSGAGTLALTKASAFTGATVNPIANVNILEGALRASISDANNPLPTASTCIRLRGGVFEIDGGGTFKRVLTTGTTANGVSWGQSATETGGGGFSAVNGDAVVDLGGTTGSPTAVGVRDTFNWAVGNFLSNDFALLFGSVKANSKIEFFDNISLNSQTTTDSIQSTREFRVVDNPNSTTDRAEISGAIVSLDATHGGYNADFLKTGDGTLVLSSGNNSYLGNTIVAGGKLQLTGALLSNTYVLQAGTFQVDGAIPATANVLLKGGNAVINSPGTRISLGTIAGQSGKATIAASATPNQKVVTVRSLAISDAATLDLANNGMIIDYEKGDPSQIAYIRGALKSGFAGGSWSGSGIVSGTAAASGSTAVGYIEAADVANRTTFFPGAPIAIDDSAILLRYTKRGDATLDGSVDFNDLVKLAQNYNEVTGNKVWAQGDFTYDGNVDFNDLVALAQNYNTSLIPAAVPGASAAFEADVARAFASVPEPSILGVTAIGTLCALTRRRHRRSAAAAATGARQ